MKTKMAISLRAEESTVWYSEGIQVLLGGLYIALLSQIEIPLKPIPVTLQTFAIFSLALFQGSRKSFFSLLIYLVAAAIGLPVFPCAYADPLWILDPTAGYCLSFPLAAYICGKFAEPGDSPSFMRMLLGLCLAQLTIYLIGVAWLSFMVGWQQALILGLYPFILFDIVKLLAALSAKMAAKSMNLN
jgi:biotin transport system substrate-specific component